MKQIKDYFPNGITGNGIFTELAKIEWWPYLDPAAMDTYFMLTSGEKNAAAILDNFADEDGHITGDKLTALAKVIHNVNFISWRNIVRDLTVEYNPIENTDYTETHKGTANTTGNTTATTSGSIDNTGDVYGFNSSSAVHDTKGTTTYNDHETSNDITSDTTNELEIRKHGNIGVTTNAQMIESDLAIWQNKIADYFIRDVCKLIALSIY